MRSGNSKCVFGFILRADGKFLTLPNSTVSSLHNPICRRGSRRAHLRRTWRDNWFRGLEESDGARDDRGDFDWNKLLAKEITPPWVPPLKSEYDTSQFDSYPDDELPWAGCDLSTVTLDAQTELLFRDF